ncbi:MAG TPA: hypothetical protein VEY09_19005 [Pyrinomonadaceae bacterium]|nr:hypothetical protein [Pyrinomonadaceae bacterium]
MSHDQTPAREREGKTEAAPDGGGLRLLARGGREDAPAETGVPAASATDVPVAAGVAPAARARLVRALLLKGTFDVLFVAALAVAAHYVAFRPSFRGAFDRADAHAAAGWVFDRAAPDRPVEVQLYVDGQFAAGGPAVEPRPDVAAVGRAPHGRVGFVFRFDPPLRAGSEVRVYAVTTSAGGARRTLRQIGNTVRVGAR